MLGEANREKIEYKDINNKLKEQRNDAWEIKEGLIAENLSLIKKQNKLFDKLNQIPKVNSNSKISVFVSDLKEILKS